MKRGTKTMSATMSPWRLFFVVALPGVVSMSTMSVYSIIEDAFNGQKLGWTALAACIAMFRCSIAARMPFVLKKGLLRNIRIKNTGARHARQTERVQNEKAPS